MLHLDVIVKNFVFVKSRFPVVRPSTITPLWTAPWVESPGGPDLEHSAIPRTSTTSKMGVSRQVSLSKPLIVICQFALQPEVFNLMHFKEFPGFLFGYVRPQNA